MACPQIVVNCPENCPAQDLKKLTEYGKLGAFPHGTNWSDWVNYCENLRRNECNQILKMHGQIKLYILTESIPYSRFVYDPQSNYRFGKNVRVGLRTRLCEELLNAKCPPNINHCNQCQYFNQLLDYLRNKGILIVDCALCPLHKKDHRRLTYKDRRIAATLCLNNNIIQYLNISPNAPIITIFPSKCGFYKTKKPYVRKRVKGEFNFSNLRGLKDTIERILSD